MQSFSYFLKFLLFTIYLYDTVVLVKAIHKMQKEGIVMDSKITVKLGSLCVEYEGPTDYLKNDLLALIERLQELSANLPSASAPELISGISQATSPASPTDKCKALNYSVNTIAAKLGGKNGREIALAAAAHLTFVEQKGNFSRQELLKAMHQANSYYKQTMGSNLSKTLARMVKDNDLLENAKGSYSLSADCRKRIENVLGIEL